MEKETIELYGNEVYNMQNIKNNNKYILHINNKNKFNEYITKQEINNKNIIIDTGGEKISLKEYLRLEQILYNLIEPAKNLSPFEKYIFAYNLVKNYKPYNENLEDKLQSRDLYKIIENEYMVCQGFATLLKDLLDKTGINNITETIIIDNSFNKAIIENDVLIHKSKYDYTYHIRNYVYIKDDKYNIDGFYISDPTFDNNDKMDLYNYIMMTDNRITESNRYTFFDKWEYNELFNIKNLDEYYEKLEFYLNRERVKKIRNNNELYNIIKKLYIKIAKLDKEEAYLLNEKYPYINKNRFEWPKNIDYIVYDIGEYILSKVNKEIPFSILIEAIKEVEKKTLKENEEELEKNIACIKENNKKMQLIKFPKRYKIDIFGNKNIIMNKNNIFDY